MMWDRVRKFLGQDEEPAGDTPVAPDAAASPVGPADGGRDAAHDAATPGGANVSPAQVEETAPAPLEPAVEVSAPGHAAQGLAADAEAAEPQPAPAPAVAASPLQDTPADPADGQPAPAENAAAVEGDAATVLTPAEGDAAARAASSPVVEPTAVEPAAVGSDQASDASTGEADQPGVVASPAAEVAAAEPPAAAPDVSSETLQEAVAPPDVEAPGVQGGTVDTERETSAAGTIPAYAPVAPGAVIGGRYTISELVGGDEASPDALTYHAADARSYERCWSCGSTDNTASTRFCQNCGAPVQNHQVTLVQTREATGETGEVAQDGAYFHVEPERRMFGAEGIGIEIGAYSAEGPHHPNEDSYWYTTTALCANSGRRSTGIVVFADGMGGYAPGSGLISSRIAATAGGSMLAALGSRVATDAALDEAEADALLREAIAAANELVLAEIAKTGEMGATFVGVVIQGEMAYIANVGDSRAYYIDPHGRATTITRDQSLVGQEVQEGRLSENDIYTAVGNNIILHAIGEPGVEEAADCYAQQLEPGSYLLVCSDGYWKTLRGAVLPQGTLDGSATLGEAARRMVDNALVQGSDDNTTVVLIAVN